MFELVDLESSPARRRHPWLTAMGLSLALFALFMPLPYVVVKPGPATDTLGRVGNAQLITITGADTFPTDGSLLLTTISVSDPLSTVRGGLVLERWVLPRGVVMPRSAFYPDDQDADAIQQRDAEAMQISQQNATTAALKYLGYDLPSSVRVLRVLADTPAEGALKAADEVLAIDGKPVTRATQVPEYVRAHQPGEQVVFKVRRDGEVVEITTGSTTNPDGQAFVGFAVVAVYEYPFDVKIRLDDVGGPSAGLMFALGIIEKLGAESLTRGRTIAGTGTIDDDGVVGGIGGITEKLYGAREKGATVFLAPKSNCKDITSVPEGMTVIPVSTLASAVALLLGPSANTPKCGP